MKKEDLSLDDLIIYESKDGPIYKDVWEQIVLVWGNIDTYEEWVDFMRQQVYEYDHFDDYEWNHRIPVNQIKKA